MLIEILYMAYYYDPVTYPPNFNNHPFFSITFLLVFPRKVIIKIF